MSKKLPKMGMPKGISNFKMPKVKMPKVSLKKNRR
jgi:hypothetical protein